MKWSTLILTWAQILFVTNVALANAGENSSVNDAVKADIILDASPEELDSSIASPPMATDDPGVAQVNKPEFTFVMANCDRSASGRSCEGDITMATGLTKNVEISIKKSVTRENMNGEPGFRGVGPTELGTKINFYDKNGLSMAIAPTYSMNDGARKKDSDGNEVTPDGRVVYIPLFVSKKFKNNTVVANIGYKDALDNHANNSVTTSLALGHALDDRSVVMTEISSERNTDFTNRRTDVRIGYARVVFPDNKNYQVSIGTSLGRSLGHTEDGNPHTTILFYVKVVKK